MKAFTELFDLYLQREELSKNFNDNAKQISSLEQKMIALTGTSEYKDFLTERLDEKIIEYNHNTKIVDTPECTLSWSLLFFGSYLLRERKGELIHPEVREPQTVEFNIDNKRYWLILSKNRVICKKMS